mmetsp:Transcript_2125/g.6294  ORF Transcript_2125/g.6294 Transcript_2125/m.6294 type:complete len:223 (-) Transcript_2125:1903-2571(-)
MWRNPGRSWVFKCTWARSEAAFDISSSSLSTAGRSISVPSTGRLIDLDCLFPAAFAPPIIGRNRLMLPGLHPLSAVRVGLPCAVSNRLALATNTDTASLGFGWRGQCLDLCLPPRCSILSRFAISLGGAATGRSSLGPGADAGSSDSRHCTPPSFSSLEAKHGHMSSLSMLSAGASSCRGALLQILSPTQSFVGISAMSVLGGDAAVSGAPPSRSSGNKPSC